MLVCKFVFTLSHDQNQIERVYNVNKDMFCVNMERILLKTGKMVYDHIISLEAPVISFVIKKGANSKLQGFTFKIRRNH